MMHADEDTSNCHIGDSGHNISQPDEHFHSAETGRGRQLALLRCVKGGLRVQGTAGVRVPMVAGGGGCISHPRVANAGETQRAQAEAEAARSRAEAEAAVAEAARSKVEVEAARSRAETEAAQSKAVAEAAVAEAARSKADTTSGGQQVREAGNKVSGGQQGGHTGGGSGQPWESVTQKKETKTLALERQFRLFDINNDGKIDLQELQTVLLDDVRGGKGEMLRDGEWSEAEVKELCNILDTNKDGLVSEDEFMSALRKSGGTQDRWLIDKLVACERNNWYQKPRAERTRWKQLLETAAAAVKPKERNAGIDSAVLRGAVGEGSEARKEVMRAVKRALRFLLSSTFTDTNEERNFLLADVLPFLQEYARRLGGFEAQIVEMRWGIREEAGDNHETNEICMEELERCMRDSLGVSYVFIAAQKYGFRPFPNKIPEEYFTKLLEFVKRDQDKQMLTEWFQLDENAVAPEKEQNPEEWEASREWSGPLGPCYVLKSKAVVDGKEWWPKFEAMQISLRDAARLVWSDQTCEEALRDPKQRHFSQRFIVSVTEEEFTRGMLRLGEDSLGKKQAFVITREFEGLVEAMDSEECAESVMRKNWIDLTGKVVDEEAQKRLKAQIAMAPKNLVVLDRKLEWGPGIDHCKLEHVRYLKDMADTLCQEVADSLLRGVQEVSVQANVVVEEASRHLKFALERAGKFCETESTKHVTQGLQRYLKRDGAEGVGNTAVVVWGKSGAGKTYLMSKMVSDAVAGVGEGGVVVVRFLGTTPASSNVRDLLESLCGQLSCAYEKPQDAIPSEFKELVKLFKEAVTEWPIEDKPLTLVLDSVDQLDDSNGGRKLEWLPVEGLGINTRLVISTLPDYTGLFQCKSLLEKRLGKEKMLGVETISEHEKVFIHLLKLQGRTATKEQMEAMSTAFEKRTEADAAGTPLWLTIVAQVVGKWRSFDGVRFPISSSVRGLILDLFKRLEARHGEALVRATLGYITLCQNTGLSETELVHLLSLNDDVLASVYEWWVPPHRTLPVLVVSRLLQDLGPYLSRRGDGSGAELVVWYHRQFWEAADSHLFKGAEASNKLHMELAKYFSGKWAGSPKPYNDLLMKCVQREKFFPGESEGERMVPAQPLALSGSLHKSDERQLNVRRLTELVHHLIRAGEEKLAVEELCSVAYVAAKFAAGAGMALMREFGAAMVQFPLSHAELVGWRAFVGRHFQHLQNAVCPLVPFQLALQEPDGSEEYKSGASYSEKQFSKDKSGLLRDAIVTWAHPSHKPQTKDPCVLNVAEHEGQVNGVVLSPDGTWLASCSDDTTIKICNASTGEVSCTIQHKSQVKCVDWSKDGQRLASGCEDGTVNVWNPQGEELCSLRGHSGRVYSVAWNHDGSLLASGSSDNTVRLWTPDGQEKGTLRGHSDFVYSVAFSPDGKTLASASRDNTVKLWDLTEETPKEKGTLRGHSGSVLSVAWNHDGSLLASGSRDKTVRLWTPDGQEKGTLRGHSDYVRCVAWNHDGSLLASASNDKTVKLWDPKTMEEKGTLKGTIASWQHLDAETKALAAKVKEGGSAGGNRTGQYIVTADGDMVYVYTATSDGEKQGEPLACFRSPANVGTVSCRGTSVVVGCSDGQVLFLEAPLLAVG